MAADTIPSRLFTQARQRPEEPAYCVKVNGAWKATRWRDYVAEVRKAGRALIALGLEPGSAVTMLGFNRPEWVILDLAAMCVGAVPAGIYTTCSSDEVQYILNHSEAAVILVEDAAQWEKVRKKRDELPHLKRVVTMRGAPKIDDPLVLDWEAFLALGADVPEAKVDERVEALEPSGLATLIYTSGTTGPPKAVMLSHQNLAWTSRTAGELVDGRSSDVMLSYLPLSHIAEQMFTVHGAATTGYCVYFAESIEKVPEDLKSVQPTVFFGVPRIWEKFHAGLSAKLREAKGGKAALVKWARGVASKVHALRNGAQAPPPALDLQYRLAQKLVLAKIRTAIGLGRARMCVSGAAPVGVEVLEFFASLDTPVHEVYGQSEDTGPTSFNNVGRTKLGTVGTALRGVEVKIADDGEVLVKGPNVFLGYYKDPKATEDTLRDGWLHSGDLGAFDKDGFLTITGRKKEIIITSGGKNVTPKNIEADLKRNPLISEAVLVGDRRNYLTVLLTLDPERLAALARENGADPKALVANEAPFVRQAVQAIVDDVNSRLARVETVKKFYILPRPLSIDDGELTPTLKIKRSVVYKHFATEVESMYSDASAS